MTIPPQLSLKEGEKENESAMGAENAKGREMPTENGNASVIGHANIDVES